jgi:hypothetical protein
MKQVIPPLHTIDDVIKALDAIVREASANGDTSGYFAALYRKVTLKVKEGITNNEFEDGPMEKLDVLFASRYINAWYAWKNKEPVTASWQKAFDIARDYWPIVLQHLLMGMNAHINLDLGIAAAELSQNKNINSLQNDFNKINSILSSLVHEVQNNLARIWPRLQWILQKTKGVDDFLVDYSMQLSRAGTLPANLPASIAARDLKVAEKSKIITNDGIIAGIILGIIRIGEKGTVKQKIENLL